jgi:hypothetical protein
MRRWFELKLPSAARGLLVIMLTLWGSACGVLETDQSNPMEARVLVSGTSPVPLLLITSTNFVYTVDEGGSRVPVPLVADTVQISLPIDQVFPFGNSDRFLVKVANPDVNQTAMIRLQLLVDGRKVFDDQASMRDASLQYSFVGR